MENRKLKEIVRKKKTKIIDGWTDKVRYRQSSFFLFIGYDIEIEQNQGQQGPHSKIT